MPRASALAGPYSLAAVHGLTDLFRIAREWAGDAPSGIRVTHWQATDDGVSCVWDSHPGAPHRLVQAIVLPSIVIPERSQILKLP